MYDEKITWFDFETRYITHSSAAHNRSKDVRQLCTLNSVGAVSRMSDVECQSLCKRNILGYFIDCF